MSKKNWKKVSRNVWAWVKDARVTIRIYNGGGFYGADLWIDENTSSEKFTSIDATSRRGDLIHVINELIEEWDDSDMFEIFRARYRAEYGRDLEGAI